jgi:FtsZ-binding cell division protein ZapB
MFIVLLVGLPTLTYAQPQKAKNALMSLKRLEAKTQMGIDYETFMNMLSNVKFPLNLLQESDESKNYPELSKAISSAFQHFSNAGNVWQEKIGGGLSVAISSPMGKSISRIYPNANEDINAGGALQRIILVKSYNYDALIKIMFHAASRDIENATIMLSKFENMPSESQKPPEDITMLKKEIVELRGEVNKLKIENELLKDLQRK